MKASKAIPRQIKLCHVALRISENKIEFQGEPGSQGMTGPRGPQGEGFPGAKVRDISVS